MVKYSTSVIFISIALLVTTSEVEYGEFDLRVVSYEVCKAPKKINCCDVTAYTYDNIWIKYDVTTKENMTAIKALFVGSLNNKELIRFRVNDMCTHIFFKPLVLAAFNLTDSCGVFKGHHAFRIDVRATTRNLYGGKFMYGNWSYRVSFFNDKCNLHCGIMKLAVTPKKKIEALF
ncbi:unnamed protein product [Spodoptera littoralis]|uniref:MD-2-related lipid-recognition domain-containing protein n=1 Tax=Spodoptera littoralis TaxID=7109 RepID=A0A9P0IK67_SPOLI|nr:unnamed protein product [Spodoptera littoralis]CAH1646536.1 unnamed protein product [Spodoptera littoralis]